MIDLAMQSYQSIWGRNALRVSRYIEKGSYFCKFNVVSHGDYVGYNPDDFENASFVSGHFGYDFARYFMPSRYSFVFLRNPVERILSFYDYCRNDISEKYPVHHLAKKLTLEGFLMTGLNDPQIRTHIWNNQVWQLAHGWGCLDQKGIDDFDPEDLLELAMAHLQEFSHVGFTETFEDDRDIICNALGWPVPKEKVFSNAGNKRQPINESPPSTICLLNELTQLDQALYASAWKNCHSDDKITDGFVLL